MGHKIEADQKAKNQDQHNAMYDVLTNNFCPSLPLAQVNQQTNNSKEVQWGWRYTCDSDEWERVRHLLEDIYFNVARPDVVVDNSPLINDDNPNVVTR